MFDLRVPAQYREWVHQDIATPGALRRNLTGRLWLFALPIYNALTSRRARRHPRDVDGAWPSRSLATLLCVRPGAAVRRRLQHHALTRPDESLGSSVWVRDVAGADRRPSRARGCWCSCSRSVRWPGPPRRSSPRRVSDRSRATPPVRCRARSSSSWPGTPSALITAPIVAAARRGPRDRGRGPPTPGPPPRRPPGPARAPPRRPGARTPASAFALWAGLIVAEALAEATGAWALSFSAARRSRVPAAAPGGRRRLAPVPHGAGPRARRPAARRLDGPPGAGGPVRHRARPRRRPGDADDHRPALRAVRPPLAARLPAPLAAPAGRRDGRAAGRPRGRRARRASTCGRPRGWSARGGRRARGPGRRCGTRSRTGCSTVACPPGTAGGSATTSRARPPRCGCWSPCSRWCVVVSRADPAGTGGAAAHAVAGHAGGVLIGMSIGLLSRGPWQQRKQARKHLVVDAGRGGHRRHPPVRDGDARPADGARDRGDGGRGRGDRRAWRPWRRGSWLRPAWGSSRAGRAASGRSPTRAAVSRPRSCAVLAAALLAGVLAAVLARRRLRRLVPAAARAARPAAGPADAAARPAARHDQRLRASASPGSRVRAARTSSSPSGSRSARC